MYWQKTIQIIISKNTMIIKLNLGTNILGVL